MAITVENVVRVSPEKVWEYWNDPAHIPNWCFASDDWGVGDVKNDLRDGGTFTTVMRANDGSAQFDFSGTYTRVVPHELIEYVMTDGRKVSIAFLKEGEGTRVRETFDPEHENTEEKQREGWQAILQSFTRYAENMEGVA